MVAAALNARPGRHIWHYDAIRELAAKIESSQLHS
jgi:hypothetical protein